MSKHTPGPWRGAAENLVVRSDAAERNVCSIMWNGAALGEADANARLIAAAPDMEAACIAIADELEAFSVHSEVPTFYQMRKLAQRLRAALPKDAKAEGER